MNDTKCNTNCLEGMRCPRCGSYEPFTIYGVTGNAVVYDDGTEEVVGIEWKEDTECKCGRCEFDGLVREFKAMWPYRCDNCAAEYHDFDGLRPVQDLELRQGASGPTPSGECPACGALCYLEVPETPEQGAYRVTVLAVPEDPQEAPIRLGAVSVEAADEAEARRLGMDRLWDPRLDAAGYSPATAVQEEAVWEIVVTPFEDFGLEEVRS